jgi:outer membrane immunogenic protein
MRKYLIAVLLAGSVATPAFAQDAAPFSGLRVEGIVGYDTTDIEDDNADGIVYGVGVGYDIQSGSVVFGIDGEANESNIDQCFTGGIVANDELCAQAGREFYAGARIGAVLGSNALLYARAGYANARVELAYDHPTNNALDMVSREELDGVRVGAGLEYAIGSNSFVKAEYRYSNYEQGFERHQAVAGFGFRF